MALRQVGGDGQASVHSQYNSLSVLCVGNVFEYNYRHWSGLPDEDLKAHREGKANFAVSGESALFWGAGRESKVVVMPLAPDPERIAHLSDVLGTRFRCIVPRLNTGFVCRDLLRDSAALSDLCDALDEHEVEVIPWGATTDFYLMIESLSLKGIKLYGDYPAPASRWVVDYADSKSGGRAILEHIARDDAEFSVPAGLVCHGRAQAIPISAWIMERERSVVIKSDLGAGGRGVRVVTNAVALPVRDRYSHIAELLSDDDLWANMPIVVERLIGGGQPISTPTSDGLITASGQVISMGMGDMVMNHTKDYVGVEMGLHVLSQDVGRIMSRVGLAVGGCLQELGYVGWYDVDFLASSDSPSIFGAEINARRTGPTQVIEVAKALIGPEWESEYYACAFEKAHVRHDKATLSYILETFRRVEKVWKNQAVRVIPLYTLSLDLPSPYVGFIVIAKSKASAQSTVRDICSQLS